MSERVKPDVVFENNGSRWESYSAEKVGMKIITQYQENTGAILGEAFANTDLRSQSNEAWAGSRQSRAPGDIVDIFQEITDKSVDSDKRLDSTFKSYGHASVADMASMAVHFANVPMHLPMNLFNTGATNSGQEKSTRYQKQFSGAVLHPLKMYLPGVSDNLEKTYQELGKLSIDNFNKQKPLVTEAYENFFKYTTKDQAKKTYELLDKEQIQRLTEESKKKNKDPFDYFYGNIQSNEKGALESRVLDTVRFNLLLGQSTGFVYKCSARDWAKVISQLKSSELTYYQDIGQQIETFLSPDLDIEAKLDFKSEAPSLVKYTAANNTMKNNLVALKNYLTENKQSELIDIFAPDNTRDFGRVMAINNHQRVSSINNSSADKLLAQYIIAAYPGAYPESVFDLIKKFDDNDIINLSKIIFNEHTKYNEMPQQIATPQDLTLNFEGTLGELRDFNRQRAWGRFMTDIPLFNGPKVNGGTIDRIMSKGWGLPSYVADVPEFNDLRMTMNNDFKNYYEKTSDLFEKINKEFGNDIDYHFMINLLPLGHRSDLLMHGNIKQAHYMTNLRIKPGGHINYRQLAFDAAQLVRFSNPIYFAMMQTGSRPNAASRSEFFDRS